MSVRQLLNCLTLVCVALSIPGCKGPGDDRPVVLAPASMQGVLEVIADRWEEEGHQSPILSFAGTPAVVRQVDQGAPADIVIVADREWMDWMEARSLVRLERVVASNTLVLVGATASTGNRSIREKLADGGEWRLALADPESVPAGRYARHTLTNMGIWEDVRDRVVPTENVRAALALVEAGEAELGIVYASDVRESSHIEDVVSFDDRDVPAISYHAAVVNSSQHDEAEGFLEFLGGPAAQGIFLLYGFRSEEQAP